MSAKSNFVAFLLTILVSVPESETANITTVISKSPSPSYAVEGKNFTLDWNYTLDGTIGSAQITIERKSGRDVLIGRGFSPGTITVQAGFKARFRARATETRAELTILAVQRSDEEKYTLTVLPTGAGSIIEPLILVVNFSSKITSITGQNVTEGGNVTLKCLTDGKPTPTITWTRLSDDIVVTMPLIHISRHDSGTYRCTADNGVGIPATREVSIDVQYKPDTVSLVANATENTNCCDFLWVLLTCEASDANPPVESYQLLEEEEVVATSSYGTWIMGISEGKDHVYSCKALHLFGNVTADSVIVTFNVPAQISVFASGSQVVIEGGNVSLYCNASAYPDPIVTWSKLNAGGFTELGSWLNFTSIGRDEAGDYICIANNTCGKRNSSRRTIDVQFAPENASLITNLSTISVVCAGMFVNFTCSVEAANPAVNIFALYENGSVISKKNHSGVWIVKLDAGGEVTYQCQASNSVGTSRSKKTFLFVEVPASVDIKNDTIVVAEGRNVTLHCFPSGFPSPNVSWIDFSNDTVEEGRIMKFLNIRRYDSGSYTCLATNACGSDGKKVDIVVECESM